LSCLPCRKERWVLCSAAFACWAKFCRWLGIHFCPHLQLEKRRWLKNSNLQSSKCHFYLKSIFYFLIYLPTNIDKGSKILSWFITADIVSDRFFPNVTSHTLHERGQTVRTWNKIKIFLILRIINKKILKRTKVAPRFYKSLLTIFLSFYFFFC